MVSFEHNRDIPVDDETGRLAVGGPLLPPPLPARLPGRVQYLSTVVKSLAAINIFVISSNSELLQCKNLDMNLCKLTI